MIYLILCDKKYVKIGYSRNPENRIQKLKTDNPYKIRVLLTFEGDRQTEKGFHEAFATYRYKGEWFRYSGLLKNCIIGCLSRDIQPKNLKEFQKIGLKQVCNSSYKRAKKRNSKRAEKLIKGVDKYRASAK